MSRTLRQLMAVAFLLTLSGCAEVPIIGQSDFGDGRAELYGSKRVTQVFFSSDRNLNRVNVWLNPSRALIGKKSVKDRRQALSSLTGKNIVMRLYLLGPVKRFDGSLSGKKPVVTLKLPARKIRSAGMYRFAFDALADSKEQQYLLELTAPDLTRELAVSTSVTDIDRYSGGYVLINGEPRTESDLRFLPFIRMSPRMVLNSAVFRLRADAAFMVIWAIMLVTTAGATVWLWRRAAAKRSQSID